MKPIPLIGGSYEARSVSADAERTVNLYIERADAPAMYGIGGLVLQYVLTGECRGACVMNGRTFIVAGASLYETTGGVATTIGTLQTSSGRVGMINNDTMVVIVDGVVGYAYDGTTFAAISDPDFPNGVTQCAWEGQYFIVGVDGSKRFYISEVGTDNWNGLDFASAENKPETLRALIVLHDRLFLYTTSGCEQWANTGAQAFAFERDTGSSIEVGIEARDTLQSMNNGVFWLGRDKEGGGMVFNMQGGTPQRISTHALESILQGADRTGAYAITYQQLGHAFYCLTIPSLERTFVYDAAVQKWTENGQWIDDSGSYKRWPPFFHVYNGQHIVGDLAGNVYTIDTNVKSQRWMRRLPVMKANQARQFIYMLELDMEVGISATGEDAQVMLRYSTDAGKTFSGYRQVPIGKQGMTRQRVRFPRCGQGRQWVLEFSGTDNYKPALFGLYGDMQVTA